MVRIAQLHVSFRQILLKGIAAIMNQYIENTDPEPTGKRKATHRFMDSGIIDTHQSLTDEFNFAR